MVVRSFSWKVPHFHRLVRYISKNRDHPERLEVHHNLRLDQDISEQFWQNESYRRRGKVMCFHEVLSFHKDDTPHLTRDVLEDLVRRYLELRAPNALAFGMTHHDRDHVHVHLMISSVELRSSRSLWMSKERFAAIQEELERYQRSRYPELRSIVHEKTREQERGLERGWEGEAIAHFREAARETGLRDFYGRCEQALVDDVIARCYKEAHSREDFLRRVVETGIDLYEWRLSPWKRVVGTRIEHEWNIKGGRVSRTFVPLKVDVAQLPDEHPAQGWGQQLVDVHEELRSQELCQEGGISEYHSPSRIQELEAIQAARTEPEREQTPTRPPHDQPLRRAEPDRQRVLEALQRLQSMREYLGRPPDELLEDLIERGKQQARPERPTEEQRRIEELEQIQQEKQAREQERGLERD